MIRIQKCSCGALFVLLTKEAAFSCPICHMLYPKEVRERIQRVYAAVDKGHIDRAKYLLQSLPDIEHTSVVEVEVARIEALISRREILGR